MSTVASLDAFLAKVAQRDGHQPEFLQAVREVFTSIWPFLEANPKYRSEGSMTMVKYKSTVRSECNLIVQLVHLRAVCDSIHQ